MVPVPTVPKCALKECGFLSKNKRTLETKWVVKKVKKKSTKSPGPPRHRRTYKAYRANETRKEKARADENKLRIATEIRNRHEEVMKPIREEEERSLELQRQDMVDARRKGEAGNSRHAPSGSGRGTKRPNQPSNVVDLTDESGSGIGRPKQQSNVVDLTDESGSGLGRPKQQSNVVDLTDE